jgi:hypothetical protein
MLFCLELDFDRYNHECIRAFYRLAALQASELYSLVPNHHINNSELRCFLHHDHLVACAGNKERDVGSITLPEKGHLRKYLQTP